MWEGGPTLVPDAVSYNTTIKACANAFQVGKALEVYREMARRWVGGWMGGWARREAFSNSGAAALHCLHVINS
jgi:pentatricopeptide repeat protein